MDQKRRRPVMMLIILVTGTLLIMLNLPLIIVILGTLLAGAAGLLITGSVSISREKTEKKEKEDKKEKKKKPAKEKEGKGLFSGLTGALKRDKKKIAPASKEAEIKKIDDMLAQAIEGGGPEVAAVTAAAGAMAEEEEPEKVPQPEIPDEDESLLLALSDEDFGEDIFDEIKVGEEEDAFPSMDEDELDKQFLIGGTDSVDDILAAHAAELEEEGEELPDIGGEGGIESISGLDSLDLDEETLLAASLDELDLEEEEEEPEEFEPPLPLGEEEEPEEVEEIEEVVSGDLEMISFASGVEDDDMISELKSQKKKKKQEVDLSLVRELRDVKIDVSELEEEMEEVLGFLDKKKEES